MSAVEIIGVVVAGIIIVVCLILCALIIMDDSDAGFPY